MFLVEGTLDDKLKALVYIVQGASTGNKLHLREKVEGLQYPSPPAPCPRMILISDVGLKFIYTFVCICSLIFTHETNAGIRKILAEIKMVISGDVTSAITPIHPFMRHAIA